MATMTETTGPILVCGGAGYIGSHTILCLLQQGYNVVVVDNLVNSSMVSLDRVAELANLDDTSRKERLVFHNVDLCDRNALKRVFETSPTFSACIHFAGLKVNKRITKNIGYINYCISILNAPHQLFSFRFETRPSENQRKFL